MNEQIEKAMRAAMRDMITEVASKSELTDDDAEWLSKLVGEVCERINALTPRRLDMHAELSTCIDVALIKQMLRHGAADSDDVRRLVDTVFDRLAMLCAPSQDETIRAARAECHAQPTLALALARLLDRCNTLLSEIEKLSLPIRTEMNRSPR